MEQERIRPLNDLKPDPNGLYVLYWMQQSQREPFNHALEFAARRANRLKQGLIVGFGLTDAYPDANERHYAFMLEGLADVQRALHERGIKLVTRKGEPSDVALDLAESASLVVCDRGYLRHQRRWRERVAREVGKQVVEVEGDVVVPVDAVSDKPEFAARTIRPKIHKQLDNYVADLGKTAVRKSSLPLPIQSDFDLRKPEAVLKRLSLDRSVRPVGGLTGGTAEARRKLAAFLRSGLDGYKSRRQDPASPTTSSLSPYLHFGQISPVEVLRKVRAAKSGTAADIDAFVEELVVRRELAANFVVFESDYDTFSGLPEWARRSLHEHRDDKRPARYTRSQLEQATTHDRYWNAAMRQMVKTGHLHNHMRMYWGKKILEWSNTPEYAYRTALYLNNRYFIDGRDPNSYANVGWLFGLHDRSWQERPVFGKVRYMNDKGLERKFDMEAYVRSVDRL